MITKIGWSSLAIQGVQALFIRGLASYTDNSDLIVNTVEQYTQDHAVFVSFGDSGPNAFCMLYLPAPDALEQVVQVLHFYSEGSRRETRKLVSAVLDFVKEKGYNTLRAVNGSGRRDDVWLRVFRHKDWNVKPVKTVFDFEVKK